MEGGDTPMSASRRGGWELPVVGGGEKGKERTRERTESVRREKKLGVSNSFLILFHIALLVKNIHTSKVPVSCNRYKIIQYLSHRPRKI